MYKISDIKYTYCHKQMMHVKQQLFAARLNNQQMLICVALVKRRELKMGDWYFVTHNYLF